MLDLRKNLSGNVLDSLIFDLARDLYFDEVALKKSIYGIWRQLEDNILTQNALFFNYRYSLYTIDIFKKLLIQHSIFQQAIPIENVRMCLAILFAYHAARRFEGTIPEKNFSVTGSTDLSMMRSLYLICRTEPPYFCHPFRITVTVSLEKWSMKFVIQ